MKNNKQTDYLNPILTEYWAFVLHELSFISPAALENLLTDTHTKALFTVMAYIIDGHEYIETGFRNSNSSLLQSYI